MMATREAYGIALAQLGEENKNIVVLDADLSKSTKTAVFKEKCPERFLNAGIAEANMMTVAAGIATTGKTVFASTFAIFAAGRAFEQIRNSIAYPKLNVKIGATHAGITVGEDGASHQAIEDIALMRSVPNMTVINPADEAETKQAIKAAAELDGPVYLRLGRLNAPDIFDESYRYEIGKGVQVAEGNDATIIATGIMVSEALEARDILAEKGIGVRVINIHTIKPIDADIIVKAAKETGAIVTAEEHNIIGGLGSAVAEVLCESCPVKMSRVGVKDIFGRSGTPSELMEMYGLTSENIVNAVLDMVQSSEDRAQCF